ncbi:MAG: threonine synthase [Gammaproteobacteria bacterium]|jgi:threonine synthase|nr:threonine synthase [Gammaproteobacteria bacterium]
MKYISTRGECEPHSFEEVVLTGLAPDGGLFIPESVPQLTREQILSWKNLSYAELAFEIIRLYVDGAVEDEVLKQMVIDTYAEFNHPEVAPLKELADNEWVLELFHGPTLAFKDFALQLLGRLLDHFLQKRQQHVAILGATSGDTGSAALEGCKHSEFVDIFILHPHNRVSEVQRKQMTTVVGNNVHNIAVSGNFDDCQKIVKQAFSDQSFLPDGYQLVAVNSINWARIMAQIVYYFYAALKFIDKNEAVSFSVPTGNFGDIYAGYLAKRMGLPIKQLIIATNKNDILHRFISQNQYNLTGLEASLSPSMDIMVSSNFERFIFDMFKGDTDKVSNFVTGLSSTVNQVSEEEWGLAKANFDSASVSDETTCEVIKEIQDKHGYLLDPHTVIGVKAAQLCKKDSVTPMISLSTAHPVKFSAAVEKAGLETPKFPHHLSDLLQREETYVVMPNDLAEVETYIKQSL